MRLPGVALIVLSLFTLAGCASRNNYSWIYDSEREYVLSGFSIKPPSGKNWVLAPVDAKAPNAIKFNRTDGMPFANRSSEPNFEVTFAFAASAVLDERIQSRPSAEFVKSVTDYIYRYGVLRNFAAQEMGPSKGLGPDCVTFKAVPKQQKVQTKLGEVEATPGRGYFCLHPRQNNFGVLMLAASAVRPGIQQTDHDEQIKHFFESLKFQPVSSVQRTFPIARYRVGKSPAQVIYHKEKVWAVLKDDNMVVQVDPSDGRILSSLAVGKEPVSIAGGNSIWVANAGDKTVTKIDADKGKVIATIPLIGRPASISAGRGGVWVAIPTADSVVKIDGAKEAAVATIAVGKEPVSVNAGADGVWVANAGDGSVSLIDPAHDYVVNTIEVGGRPVRVSLLNDKKYAFVADEAGNQVVRIERKTRLVTGKVDVGARPGWINSDTDVYVALPDVGRVLRIDPTEDRIFGPPIEVGSAPGGMAGSPGILWVGGLGTDTISKVVVPQFAQPLAQRQTEAAGK